MSSLEIRSRRLWCALDELIKEIDDARSFMSRMKATDNEFSRGFTIGQVEAGLSAARSKAGKILNEETD